MTPIDLGAATLQVARGSVVTDTRRRAPGDDPLSPGTTATMVLPDGTTSPLTTLNVRATEFTVGDSGPAGHAGGAAAQQRLHLCRGVQRG